MTLQSSSSPNSAIVVTDASIKNDITTSISHIHIHNHSLTKTVHHAAYVTSTEAELFAIRCGINMLPSRISWDYCEKINSNNIINHWKMTFQVSDGKGRSFLNLVDGNYEDIELSYIKGGLWLQAFGYSNLLCTRATRAVTNYALIGEYYLRFFPNEDFSCLCGNFPIESRRHVLYDCKRHNEYWNPRKDSLWHFVLFLIANPKAFTFIDYSQLVASN